MHLSGVNFSFTSVFFQQVFLSSHWSNYKTSKYEQAKGVHASGCKMVYKFVLEIPFHSDIFAT